MIIERFGRFKDILLPGLHWVWPIMESKRKVHWRYLEANGTAGADETRVVSVVFDRIDMREHVIDLGKQTVITVRSTRSGSVWGGGGGGQCCASNCSCLACKHFFNGGTHAFASAHISVKEELMLSLL